MDNDCSLRYCFRRYHSATDGESERTRRCKTFKVRSCTHCFPSWVRAVSGGVENEKRGQRLTCVGVMAVIRNGETERGGKGDRNKYR
jgi:hypothetical protein